MRALIGISCGPNFRDWNYGCLDFWKLGFLHILNSSCPNYSDLVPLFFFVCGSGNMIEKTKVDYN